MTLPKLSIVLGGAASGKSAFAESLVVQSGKAKTYLATAQAIDDEMSEKVARHRQMRGEGWNTIEEPFAIASVVRRADADQIILVDCATLWLSNVLLAHRDIAEETAKLITALRVSKAPVVIVTNEVGQGIVPDNKLARSFREAQGTLNQTLAAEAGLVLSVMAGLPMVLKGQLP